MAVSPEFIAALKALRAHKGSDLTAEEISQAYSNMPEEPTAAQKAFSGVDTFLANRPLVKAFGDVKHKVEDTYRTFEEDHPIASIPTNTLLNLAFLPAKAIYGAENLIGKMVGVEDLDALAKLSDVMPKTAKSLKSDPSARDLLTAGMLMKGPIESPTAPKWMGSNLPARVAKGTGNTARIGYNAAVDPIGSIFKYPEWDAARRATKDAEGQAAYQKQIQDKIDKYGKEKSPAPLSDEEMAVAEHLRANNMLPIQAEMRRRIENTQKSLRDEGVESGGVASEIVNEQRYGLSDAEVIYLANHPDFMGDVEIQRMHQNILDRPSPPSKPTLAEGGSRSPRKSFGSMETSPPPTNITVVDHPRPLRTIGEQPPLRGQEDVAGTSGPLATTEDGVLFHPELKVEEGANAPALGTSKYSAEGKNIPEDTVHAQENIDTYRYPEEAHIPEDAYGLRRRIDESANWIYNKQGVKEAGRDAIMGGISSRLRNKYQKSSTELPRKFRTEKLKKLVDSENAMIVEENKLAPPEARKPLVEFPKTIGDATSLLNRDTVRAFEQQEKLKPAIVGEREVSLANQMGGSGDPRALAEELSISRQYPELKEFSERVAKAKQYNKDVEAHQAKIDNMKKETESLPFSRTRKFSDPEFLDDFAKQILFFGPEDVIAKHFAIKSPELILGGIKKLGINPRSNWITKPRAASGPWGLMQNADETFKEGEQ